MKNEKAGRTPEWYRKRMTRRELLVSRMAIAGSAVLAACSIKLGGKTPGGAASGTLGSDLPDGAAGSAAGPGGSPSGGASGGSAAAESSASGSASSSAGLEPTPACGHQDTTAEVTEGPYFTPNSPERSSLLEQGMKGTKLTITGYVMTTGCQPVKHALLDSWQADDSGQYDNSGYRLRGHQYTDDKGKFALETIGPGLYPGRTRHIHVKFQAPGGKILTTQLFFPIEAGNARDGIFKETLLMNIRDNADGSKTGSFNFVT